MRDGRDGRTQDVPGPRPAERVEIVHTRITRLLVSGRPVVRKEPLGPDAERRLRREAGILERVRGVDGVAQLVDGPRYPDSVVLADAGTTTLAGLTTPLAVDELIGVAVGLARAVAGMHRCGVLHRDIPPANVVVSGNGAPCLVDFALATSVAERLLTPPGHIRAGVVDAATWPARPSPARNERGPPRRPQTPPAAYRSCWCRR